MQTADTVKVKKSELEAYQKMEGMEPGDVTCLATALLYLVSLTNHDRTVDFLPICILGHARCATAGVDACCSRCLASWLQRCGAMQRSCGHLGKVRRVASRKRLCRDQLDCCLEQLQAAESSEVACPSRREKTHDTQLIPIGR